MLGRAGLEPAPTVIMAEGNMRSHYDFSKMKGEKNLYVSRLNKQIIKDFYEKVVNTGDCSLLSCYVDPKILDDIRRHVLAVRQTFPDLRLVIDKQVAEDDMVVSCVTMTGTHKGEWVGIFPTGKAIVVTAVNVDRLEHGLQVEHGGAANMLEAMMMAGAVIPK